MEPSSEEGTTFKEQVLPQASLNALKDSQKLGITVGAPTIEGDDSLSITGTLDSAQGGDGQTFTQTVLPRHRSAVKRYFEREPEK
jgi:hypothetical protein